MLNRRTLISLGGVAAVTVGLSACSTSKPASSAGAAGHVTAATAITRVYGDGQKLIAVALEYDTVIASDKLVASSFKVTDRKITKVYANTTAAAPGTGRNGRFVVLELSPTDKAAALWPSFLASGSTAGPSSSGSGGPGGMPSGNASGAPSGMPSGGPSGMPSGGPGGGSGGGFGGGSTIKAASATATQVGTVLAASGTKLAAASSAVKTTHVVNEIVDDFKQLLFKDPATGVSLRYNLFVPKGYTKAKSYPLVLFMPDATVTSTVTRAALVQGLGAVSWASAAAQAKHETFVVAAQYADTPIGNDYKVTRDLTATVNLVKAITKQYSIDRKRLYSTGQSGGGMLSMGIDIAYPDLFAASWIVAGQWDPTKVAPLAKKPLWITVSEGDAEAYPTENKILPILEKDGSTVSRAVWDGKAGVTALDAAARAQAAKGTTINYSVFKKGSVIAAGSSENALNEHLCTWRVAYTIDAIRDWMFQQHR